MITLAGTVVSAAWPVFLAAIPLGLGALIYLFRAHGSGAPQVASTLYLLARIPQYAPNRRRFLPPLQFWIELALALALALAASGVMTADSGSRVAIVVDVSKSMGARVSGDETRLQAAVRIAQADIAQASADTRFTVWSAGRSLTPRTERDGAPASVRASVALDSLESIEPSYDVDALGAQVAELLARGEYDSVWLYTDRAVEGASRQDQLRVTTIPFDPEVVYNVWISSLTLRDPERRRIDVGVSQVGEERTELTVNATCTDRDVGDTFSLAPVTHRLTRGETSLVRLGEIERSWSYCRVWLEGATDSQLDMLPSDNEAWIVHGSHRGAIGVVSALSAQALGLDRVGYATGNDGAGNDDTGTLRVVTFPSESALQQHTREGHGMQGVIFHRPTPMMKALAQPTTQSPLASLIVFPEVGVTLWGSAIVKAESQRTSGAVEITRWDEAHPILQYVRPQLLTIPMARVLKCPQSAQPVVYSASGPLICAGEEGGARYVILGFEIFPFDGRQTPTLSILTLNTLKWLFAGTHTGRGDAAATGVVSLPEMQTAVPPRVDRIAPGDEPLTVTRSRSVVVTTPGVLAIADSTREVKTERLIAVNAIASQESDLTLQTPIDVVTRPVAGEAGSGRALSSGQTRASAHNVRAETTRYELFFAWCALCIVVIDLVRRVIGRMARRARA